MAEEHKPHWSILHRSIPNPQIPAHFVRLDRNATDAALSSQDRRAHCDSSRVTVARFLLTLPLAFQQLLAKSAAIKNHVQRDSLFSVCSRRKIKTDRRGTPGAMETQTY